MQFLWHIVALILSNRRVANWLIRRAQRTPYTHIPSRDGSHLYMERWWLFNPYRKDDQGNEIPARWSWLPSIRIHHICRRDIDRHLHDHPWNARTIVLSGFYFETVEGPHGHVSRPRFAGYTGRLLYGQYHRIDHVSDGGVWTLFFTWKHMGAWGFKVNGRKVHWREYLAKQGAAR